MIVKGIDVRDAKCFDRPCYWFGFDKGSFTPGVGYTSYHAKERKCCLTRHIKGCPHNAICPVCRSVEVDGPGTECEWCKIHGVESKTVEREPKARGEGEGA